MSYLVHLVATFFGIMLLFTSIDKIINWHTHLGSMEAYQLLKQPLIKPFLGLFIFGELFVSVSLFFAGVNLYNTLVCLALLGTYTIAIGINLVRGNYNISCGCGSILENDQLNVTLIHRNLFLIGLYLLLFLVDSVYIVETTPFEKIAIAFVSLGVFILLGVFKELRIHVVMTNKILDKVM